MGLVIEGNYTRSFVTFVIPVGLGGVKRLGEYFYFIIWRGLVSHKGEDQFFLRMLTSLNTMKGVLTM